MVTGIFKHHVKFTFDGIQIVTSLLFKCPPGQTNLARREADGLTDSHEKVKSQKGSVYC